MKHYLILLLCLPLTGLLAQNSDHHILSAQGDYSRGESISLSWSIGDLVTEAVILDESVVTQGFHQPVISVREIKPTIPADHHAVDSRGETSPVSESEDFTATVYPNPFGNDITVEVQNTTGDYFLEIFSQDGTLLSSDRSNLVRQVMQLQELPPAHYVLQIRTPDAAQFKAFHIIKSR